MGIHIKKIHSGIGLLWMANIFDSNQYNNFGTFISVCIVVFEFVHNLPIKDCK